MAKMIAASPSEEPLPSNVGVPVDPWKHRAAGMRCGSCMWFAGKERKDGTVKLGRCRRHAPSMNGYPVVYPADWCGDHKLNEEAVA